MNVEEKHSLIREVVNKSNILQHQTSKHSILNYLISNNYIEVCYKGYNDIIRMNEYGKIVYSYQY